MAITTQPARPSKPVALAPAKKVTPPPPAQPAQSATANKINAPKGSRENPHTQSGEAKGLFQTSPPRPQGDKFETQHFQQTNKNGTNVFTGNPTPGAWDVVKQHTENGSNVANGQAGPLLITQEGGNNNLQAGAGLTQAKQSAEGSGYNRIEGGTGVIEGTQSGLNNQFVARDAASSKVTQTGEHGENLYVGNANNDNATASGNHNNLIYDLGAGQNTVNLEGKGNKGLVGLGQGDDTVNLTQTAQDGLTINDNGGTNTVNFSEPITGLAISPTSQGGVNFKPQGDTGNGVNLNGFSQFNFPSGKDKPPVTFTVDQIRALAK